MLLFKRDKYLYWQNGTVLASLDTLLPVLSLGRAIGLLRRSNMRCFNLILSKFGSDAACNNIFNTHKEQIKHTS